MGFDKKTMIVLSSSIVAGFIGDVFVYSLAESKGKRFGVHIPKGWQLVNLIALGLATGLVIDFSLRQVQGLIETKQEKELADLVESEIKKVDAGAISPTQTPTRIVWT